MSYGDSRQRSKHWRESTATLVEIHPKSFGVKVDDTTWTVLPAALDKYGIGRNNWETYALFICYDADRQGDSQKQRCISYDEKPLKLWIWLRNTGKHPAFVLKHFDDLQSPISVIRERHARRQAASTETLDFGSAGSDIRDTTVVSGLDVRDGSIAMGDTLPATGVTYAVAIFPYWAEAPDELDAALDDAFVVLCRSAGWWLVQRHSTQSGTINICPRNQGWVPSGALLETSVPVATAIAEATTARMLVAASPSSSAAEHSKPILRSSILTTSFPSVTLRDYHAEGDGQLSLITEDLVRVYKKYNNWSYVVKDDGDRGWVPSWFLGKVPSDAALPSATRLVL